MTKLEVEIHDDVISIITRIKNINDADIELVIPEGAVLLENILNFKLINELTAEINKTVQYTTLDETGQNLLSMLNEEEGAGPFANFAPEEQDLHHATERRPKFKNVHSRIMPLLKLPHLNIKLPQGNKKPVIIGLGVFFAAGVFLFFLLKTPTAEVKIVVNSQPLTKSIQITADKSKLTRAEDKTLRGIPVSTTEVDSLTGDTTGEKMVGKKAEGRAKIYNLTDSDKEFKKGSVLTYDADSGSINYTTDDSITVPATTYDDTTTPPTPTFGEVEVDVTAENIGDGYNIDKDSKLEVKGYKKSQFTATATKDFSGGESKKVKMVTQVDKDKLAAALTTTLTDKANKSLDEKVLSGQKFISGSAKVIENKDSFDHNVNDEVDKLTLTKTVTSAGLSYSISELNKLIDDLLVEYIPEGFVLSDKEREINVQVLGVGDNTVLDSDKADLQVTIKTFVVPDIDEDEIKESLKGKSIQDAQDLLSKIRNVKTYSLNVSSKIPLFKRMPGNTSKINLTIERQ